MQETSRKRKIAVFANGWSIEALLRAAEGIRKYAEKEDFDTFVFLSYASYSEYESLNRGELNVYDLPRLQDYDGVIVFSTMLNSDETARKICEKAKKKNVPAVSIGMPIGEAPCVTVENEKGMRELVTHLIEVHDVKRIVFMGGTPDHVDSMARLHTTEEVLKEHGLRLDPEDVCYGNWGGVWPRELMRKLVETKELPDAVVCANDIMALSAAAELNLLGVDVPKDVIVTGFDEIAYGKDFYPALSTVAQNFEEVGYLCCERLFEMIEGRECPKMTAVSTSFVLGESCGCTSGHDYENYHRNYCRTSYQRHEDEASLEQTERVLRGEISGIPDYHALKRRLQAHYLRNHRYEGSSFYIVLHSEYFEDVTADEMELWEKVNTEKMEVIVAIRDGETVKDPEADRSQLIPNYVKEDGVQRIHYIVPLHYYEANYGYAIFSEDSFILRHDMMYPYLEKVQQSLKLLRINLRLDMVNRQLQQIYDRDPMTGLFNRLAYENRAQALFDECKKNGKPMSVMFVDINYMKRINDEFGHLHGDNAIKAVADSIKENSGENWIPVRYGGDEFLIIAPDCDAEEAGWVQKAILERLDARNNDGSQPYKISVSCGYVVSDPEKTESLQECVQEADKLMYEYKQEAHRRDGK